MENTDTPAKTANRRISKEVEYYALRAEILERVKRMHQIPTFVFTVAGAVLALNVLRVLMPSSPKPVPGLDYVFIGLLFAYPLFATWLLSEWLRQGILVDSIGEYIQKNLEPPGAGWEAFWQRHSETELRFGDLPGWLKGLGGLLDGLGLSTLPKTRHVWVDMWGDYLIISEALTLVVGIIVVPAAHLAPWPFQWSDVWFLALVILDAVAVLMSVQLLLARRGSSSAAGQAEAGASSSRTSPDRPAA